MINLWFGIFLKIPQFIGVWGGIADELGGTVCLLLMDLGEMQAVANTPVWDVVLASILWSQWDEFSSKLTRFL